MKTKILCLIVIVFFGCSKTELKSRPKNDTPSVVLNPPAKTSSECICPMDYAPVCGANQITYSNSCSARCAEVSFSEGACSESKKTKKKKVENTYAQ